MDGVWVQVEKENGEDIAAFFAAMMVMQRCFSWNYNCSDPIKSTYLELLIANGN